MNPTRKSAKRSLFNPPDEAKIPLKKTCREFEIPHCNIFSSDDMPNRYILTKRDGSELTLEFLSKGDYHNVYKIEGDETRLIKTLVSRPVKPRVILKDIKKTDKAIKSLNNRDDLRVCRYYTHVLDEGFYEVENIPGKFEAGNLESIEKIISIVARMIEDPKTYIFDFQPRNVHRDENGQVVIVDPDLKNFQWVEYDDELEDMALEIKKNIKKWSAGNESCKKAFQEAVNREKLTERTTKLYQWIFEAD